jgi:hypothetical protein
VAVWATPVNSDSEVAFLEPELKVVGVVFPQRYPRCIDLDTRNIVGDGLNAAREFSLRAATTPWIRLMPGPGAPPNQSGADGAAARPQ